MFIVFLLHLCNSNLCGLYSCFDISQNAISQYLEQQCINQVGGLFQLEICKSEYFSYCSPNYNNTYCSLPPTISDLSISFPGEPCMFDRNCLNSKCINGFCKGAPLSSLCFASSQCDVGLYCNGTSCESLITSGNICLEDSECKNNYGCLDYNCVSYFSATPGTQVLTCENSQNMLCSTGSCQISELGAFVCVSLIATSSQLPKNCLNDADCTIVDSVVSYSTGCQCGYNSNAEAFCYLAPGDLDYKMYMNYMKTWLASPNITSCHSMRKMEPICIETYASYEFYVNLTYYQETVNGFPSVQNNDKCIQNIYTPSYWQAANAFNNLVPRPIIHDSALLISAFLTILLA